MQSEKVGVRGAAPHLEYNTDGKAHLNAYPESANQSQIDTEKISLNLYRQTCNTYLASFNIRVHPITRML